MTNYAAAYATGLLCGRRLLTDLKLNDLYSGIDSGDVDGTARDMYKDGEIDDDKRPFKVILDVGLNPTTTGNKVFGALKGLSDAGVYIPHNNKRFPGHKIIAPEEKGDKAKETFDPEVHKNKIFGITIQEYMEDLEKENKEKYNKLFSVWAKCLKANKTTSLKDLYTKVHAAIRKSPARVAKKAANQDFKVVDAKNNIYGNSKGAKWYRARKITKAQRDQRVQDKKAKIVADFLAEE